MKNSFNFFLSISTLFITLCIFSCKGDKGTPGPAGPKGNSDVVMYTYGSRTITGGPENYIIPDMTVGRMDSSMILAYYNPSSESPTAWYPVPGIGPTASYESRGLVYQDAISNQYVYALRLLQVGASTNYTNPVTISKFRIIVAKASSIIPEARTPAVDYNNYNAVKEYYNLAD